MGIFKQFATAVLEALYPNDYDKQDMALKTLVDDKNPVLLKCMENLASTNRALVPTEKGKVLLEMYKKDGKLYISTMPDESLQQELNRIQHDEGRLVDKELLEFAIQGDNNGR